MPKSQHKAVKRLSCQQSTEGQKRHDRGEPQQQQCARNTDCNCVKNVIIWKKLQTNILALRWIWKNSGLTFFFQTVFNSFVLLTALFCVKEKIRKRPQTTHRFPQGFRGARAWEDSCRAAGLLSTFLPHHFQETSLPRIPAGHHSSPFPREWHHGLTHLDSALSALSTAATESCLSSSDTDLP